MLIFCLFYLFVLIFHLDFCMYCTIYYLSICNYITYFFCSLYNKRELPSNISVKNSLL